MVTTAIAIVTTRRSRRDGDEGISIVEVLVAVTIMAVAMAATATSVVRALQVARDSRESVIAANVAQFELERLRSIPFVDWVQAAQSGTGNTATTTATFTGPDGQVYQVDRTVTWVEAGSTVDGCTAAAAGGEGADYVRVTQTVSFPGRDIDPVTNTTIITPRITDFDPERGNVAVTIRDRDGRGAAGHVVELYDGFVRTATTDANGCAFFALLPTDPADPAGNVYTLTIDTPGHVESTRRTQLIEDDLTVSAQSTTVAEYDYDRAAAFDPRPTAAPPAAGCTMTLGRMGSPQAVDGINNLANAPDPSAYAVDPEEPAYVPDRWALQCLDGAGTPVPAGWLARVPANLAYTLTNPATSFSSLGRRVWYAPLDQTAVPDTQPRPDRELAPLFPYTDGYGIYTGRCSAGDPTLQGGTTTVLNAVPGTDAIVEVEMGLVTVTTANPGSGNPLAQRHLFADRRPDDCPDGDRLYLGRAGPGEQLRALLPYGEWVVYWATTGGGQGGVPAEPMACADHPASCVLVPVGGDPVNGVAATARRADEA